MTVFECAPNYSVRVVYFVKLVSSFSRRLHGIGLLNSVDILSNKTLLTANIEKKTCRTKLLTQIFSQSAASRNECYIRLYLNPILWASKID